MIRAARPILASASCFPLQLLLLIGSNHQLGASALKLPIDNTGYHALTSSRNDFLASYAARGLSSHVNIHDLFTHSQIISIQVTACVLAAISFFSSVTIMYWFVRMRKRFRHRLIMILITADVIRSFWLFIFPIVSIAKRSIPSSSKFCQVSGFFTQMGIEMADFAILAVAIHTSMQVFKPRTNHLSDEESGLFSHRHKVYAFCAIIPPVLASLAYIRSSTEGYMSTAAFCSLPLRPFWYRLAISWVPRYLIMLIIAALYIAVYVHVAAEFRVIGWLGYQGSSVSAPVGDSTTESNAPNSLITPTAFMDPNWSKRGSNMSQGLKSNEAPLTPTTGAEYSLCSKIPTRTDGSTSTTADQSDFTAKLSSFDINPIARNVEHSSEAGDLAPTQVAQKEVDGCVDFVAEAKYRKLQPSSGTGVELSDQLPRNAETARIGNEMMSTRMQERHSATQRQLRSLFIYPLCYFFIWLIPFVYHLTTYSNFLAQNPVFPLVLLSYLCISSMGAVDSLIFSLRERPWRHIPNSDGTFLGSFAFWNYRPRNSSLESETQSQNRKQRRSAKKQAGSTTEAPTNPRAADTTQSQPSGAAQESKESDQSELHDTFRKSFEFNSNSSKRPGMPRAVSTPVTVDRELYWIDRRLSAALLFKNSQRH